MGEILTQVSLTEEKQMIDLYELGKTIPEICEILSRGRITVWRRLKDNNVKRRRGNQFINVDINKVLELYKELKSTRKVGEILNLSPGKIQSVLKSISYNIKGTTTRKYIIDQSYFEEINTPQKAYILGFLASDGYNSNYTISATIQNIDVEVLKFLQSQICKEVPIQISKSTPNVSIIKFNSKKFCEDLTKLGIIRNKSKTLKFPTIEKNLLSHFIRGCFDGDGSVFYRTYKDGRKKKGIIFSYCSASREFIDTLEVLLRENCDLDKRTISIHNKTGCFYLTYSGSKQVHKIFNYLYDNSCFHLNRKYEKFLNYYNG